MQIRSIVCVKYPLVLVGLRRSRRRDAHFSGCAEICLIFPGKIFMNICLHPIFFATVLTMGISLFVSGCNRMDAVPAKTATPVPKIWNTEIDDAVVTIKVKTALIEDKKFNDNELNDKKLKDNEAKDINANSNANASDIKVETFKGMVSLSGYVTTQTQIEHATTIARAVEGVKGVTNNLSIKK